MAGLVPHTRRVFALLPALQPLQLAIPQVEAHGRSLAAPRPAQQSWRRRSRRQRRALPPARLTTAAALSRPSVEDRLAVALDTPASRELVSELAAAVAFIESTGASVNMAFLLAKEAGRLPPDQCRGALATLQPKFELFQQRCAAAPDACDCLAIALVGCPSTQAALALPPADFEAVLDFIESQAALLPRFAAASRRASPEGLAMAAAAATAAAAAAAGARPAAAASLAADASAAAAAVGAAAAPASPTILYAFFKWQSLVAGALLQQHPGPYLQRTAPWLREQLGWSDADAATAALLSSRMPQLCELDTSFAQSSLEWLLAQGLSRQQAGQLLLASLRRTDGDLLSASPAQLAERQQRIVQLAAQWRVSPALAAVLWLTQEGFLGSAQEEGTSRLLAVLRDEAGLTEEQLLDFALAGGLRGEQAAIGGALDAALARLKRLLLVCGSWQGVAAALQHQPALLFVGDEAVEGLLPEPAQQATWRVVAAMEGSG